MRPLLLGLMLVGAPAWAKDVVLPTVGGSVNARVDGKGPHGVLLVGGAPGGTAWDEARGRLAAQGFVVLSLTLPEPAPTTAASAGAWIEGVRAGVGWLVDQGAATVSVVGAEGGGAVALHAARALPKVEQVVWLSPRVSGTGLPLGDDLAAWSRPLLLVTSADDATGVRAVGALAPRAAGDARAETVPGARVGADLLARTPAVEALVAGRLHEAAARALTAGGAPRTTVDAGAIPTKGTAYGGSSPR